ncbi:MAG: ABC transporter ATP-binding protein, partial [Caldisphaera sp.]
MSEIIKFENLSWRYLGTKEKALNNINFTINRGEFLVLAGANDSGKTSLLMCINGLIPHTLRGIMEGKITVDGIDTQKSNTQVLSEKVGYVFSDPESQFLTMTVEEEIAYSLENAGLPLDEIRDRIKWAMEVVNLSSEYLNKAPYELSGGQKQRVAIASVIARRPPILVLDEPTSQVDPIGKTEILDVIKNIHDNYNMTVVIAEHRFDRLMKLASRIALLKKGEIKKAMQPEEFFSDPKELISHGIYPPEFNIIENYFIRKNLLQRPISLSLDEFLEKFNNILSKIKKDNLPQIKEKPSYKDPSKKLIEMKKIRFNYPDGTLALKEINLDIYKGEFLAIIGQNGSGKTTMAKIMAGILKPTEGQLIIDGKDVTRTKIKNIASRVGYIFQNPDHQLFEQTIAEEISYGPKNLGIKGDELIRRVTKSMEIVGLPESYTKENPFTLSKGWRQKVAIASILAMEPDVIIVDEPTTGQDFPQADKILNFLSALNKAGKTIIIITHDMTFVARYCNRAIVVNGGEILLDGPIEYVFNQNEQLEITKIKPNDTAIIGQILMQFGLYININDFI